MNYFRTTWSLLRYRVAIMLALFALLAVAYHHRLQLILPGDVLVLLALTSGYISATSFNDLADEAIDKINHAGKPGRLLVTGQATRRDLAVVGISASIVMLLCGCLLGLPGLILTITSLFINVAYSLPPLKLSYRTYLVPFVLAIGYVLVPYGLGLVLLHRAPMAGDYVFAAALYALFLARINLKDFRDRAGDAQYGKPTLLLRHGKPVTITLSAIALWVGLGLQLVAFWHLATVAVLPVIIAFGLLVTWLLARLATTKPGPAELVIIGVAAKIGNGLLLSLLAILVLPSSTAPWWVLAVVLALLLAASAGNLKFLSQDPKLILESYRG